MTDPTAAFSKMVPGFDFLQSLVKGASAAMPNVGQWIAPTIDPEELEKRINDLRTVQYWLEQNARLLGATIQALEVQRMTLSTLKGMNVSLADLTESLKIRMPEPAPAPAPPPAPAASFFHSAAPAPEPEPQPEPAPEPATAAAPPAGVVDPMQWWGALTQQFTQLAASALKDTGQDGLAGAMVKQGLEAATETFRKASSLPAAVAQKFTGGAKPGATAAKQPTAKRPATNRPATKKAGAARPPR